MHGAERFYITTPIYYVNDVPHIGHAYTTIAADVLARYWRLRGRDVFFLTGLDEHGQKVQQAAAKAGIDPQAHCDRLAPQFRNLWKRLNISNDGFIRTTDPAHKSVVQRHLQQLFDKQLIYKADYTGWYCTYDERFWTEKDVADGLCPDCKRPIERLSEHNYFFKMGQYQERLIKHIEQHPEFIRPESRRNEVLGFLHNQQLGDLSISRPKSRLSWGIELPFDTSYVTYVWFDALVNYMSALEYLPKERPAGSGYWPADVHLVGKDILTTHAVYWSTMLMALELPLPRTIFAHGWWTVDGEKMSKSRGNVVDPNQMIDQFGADAFRYFLLREVPFGQDGDFSQAALVNRINTELANDLGNLLSRTLTLVEKFSDGKIPEFFESAGPLYTSLRGNMLQEWQEGEEPVLAGILQKTENLEFNRALEQIIGWVQVINQYFDKTAPWKLGKTPQAKPQLDTVLYSVTETLRLLSLALYPFMPYAATEIRRQLGIGSNAISLDGNSMGWGGLLPGTPIRKGASLFPRVLAEPIAVGLTESVNIKKVDHEKEITPQGAKTVSETPAQPIATPTATPAASSETSAPAAGPTQITIDEFMKIELKTARILSAERVPRSEKLLKLRVSLGSEQRQIVAGIGKKYEPETLVGKTIVIVANLKPAKLMGIESQGMVLAAGDVEVRGLATFIEDVEPGTKVK
jgi:methionyl-tRNA synthetase